ncbi:hypothetical protein WJX82_007188 [Trebouxia sp. C0006]
MGTCSVPLLTPLGTAALNTLSPGAYDAPFHSCAENRLLLARCCHSHGTEDARWQATWLLSTIDGQLEAVRQDIGSVKDEIVKTKQDLAATEQAGNKEKERVLLDLLLSLNNQLLSLQEKENILLRSQAPKSLWDVMCRPVPDESFANHAFGQTEPLEGGRTEDTVGEWNFLEELNNWLIEEHIEDKLSAVPAKVPVKDQLTKGAVPPIDHEGPLYIAITEAIYNMVNESAKHLDYPVMYTSSHGKTGVTLVDLRATHCRTHKTCIPHEVKPPWAEACDGSNLSELMQDAERKKTMARPAAQILYYMVEEAEGKKWVPDTWKRKRADSSAKNTHSDGDDELGDDNDEDHHHDVSRSDDETDTDESYAGPSAHTRSKVATAKTSQKHSQLNDSSKQQLVSTMPGYPADTSQAYMAHLPRLHRDELNIGRAMRFGPDCVVREGQWGTQAAVYKVWDLGDSLDPLQEMHAKAFAYNKLKPLQAMSIPKLLKQGYYNYGLQACVVIARGGDILTEATLRASPHLAQQALNALASVHRHGLLHGDE